MLISNFTSTTIVANNVTFTGTGFTYTSSTQGGQTIYQPTGGTITGISTGNQSWSGFNVSLVTAFNAILDANAFNSLFFGGGDTFNWTGTPVFALSGYGGDDTFNVSNWGADGLTGLVDGGSGNDTLNLTGGINTLNRSQGVINIETINLGAGFDYTMTANNTLVTSGNALTINGSSLGAANSFKFYISTSGSAFAGDITLIGGAGNDFFQGGSGANIYNGGAGSDTVSFLTGNKSVGVTADLSNSGVQSIAGGWGGTATFISIENLQGTHFADTLIGDGGDNVLDGQGGADILNGGGGNDTLIGEGGTLDGGSGNDIAVFSSTRNGYTLTGSGSTITVTGNGSTTTLTNVEYAQFKDQTIFLLAPIVGTTSRAANRNQSFSLSSLFTAVNVVGSITAYQLWDGTADPNSGHFEINGVAQTAGTVINLTAAQLAQTTFVAGKVSDNLQIRAFNGSYWSAADNAQWAPFTVSVTNGVPFVSTRNYTLAHFHTYAVSGLFQVYDSENDPITRYQLWDGTADPDSGHFEINGVAQAARTVIDITAAQLAQTTFVTGTVSDDLQIRGFDGLDWSALDTAQWSPFTLSISTNSPPALSTVWLRATAGQTLALSNMMTVNSYDGDAIIRYQLWDGTADPNSGHFEVNGVAQAAGTLIDITAAQAAQTTFVTGTVDDDLQIRAFDGIDWSAADTAKWAPFKVGPTANHAPYVNSRDVALYRGNPPGGILGILDFGDVDDNDPTHLQYQLIDTTSDPSSGHFILNGVVQAAGTVIDVNWSGLLNGLTYALGAVPDSVQVRVSDGLAWSAPDNGPWAIYNISPYDFGPDVTTTDKSAVRGQSFALSSLFSATDPEGDTISRYQLRDMTTDPASGYFVVNGVTQTAGTVIDITAAQVAQTSFVAGGVNDSLQIRAFDGILWSAADNAQWAPINITVPVNHSPVLTTVNKSAVRGQSLTLSSLFSVSDQDGDAITQYQLLDSTTDPLSGYFTINSVAQTAGTVIDVTAAQLAQTSFVAGKVPDNLQIRAFDGTSWSAANNLPWAPFSVIVPADIAPVLTTTGKNATHGQSFALSSLFNVTDADGDTMTRYQLWDATGDPSSGHFEINGVAQAARTLIDITAAQVAQTTFVAGAVSDNLQIRAFDGIAWSAADSAQWAPFAMNVPAYTAPVVTTTAKTATRGQSLALSSLLTVSDPDGDTVTKYQLWDATSDPNSGHFAINGVAQAERAVIDVTAAQLAQTSFVAGRVSDNLQIRVFDGTSWSASDSAQWAPFTVTATNTAPVVTTTAKSLAHGQTVSLSSLFSVTDADGDTMTRYQLWDATGDPMSGHFEINGVAQAGRTLIDITAAQVAQTTFVAGAVSDSLQIRAFDGLAWSASDSAQWSPFAVNVPAYTMPVVTTTNQSLNHGQTVSLSSLFTLSDPDGDTTTAYQLWDATGDPSSGHFVVNGVVQSARTLINLTPSQLAQTSFVAGTVNDNLQIRAFDGVSWSAADNAQWSPFTVTASNAAPVVSTTSKSLAHGQSVTLSSLFSVSDADGDAITAYQLWDATNDPNSGHFAINGVAQAERAVIDLTPSQLAQTTFLVGTLDDNIQIRAFDGFAWSAPDSAQWAPFHITAT